MTAYLPLILSIASILLVASVEILRLVAPRTATTKDDEWLARLEALESVVAQLAPAASSKPDVKQP